MTNFHFSPTISDWRVCVAKNACAYGPTEAPDGTTAAAYTRQRTAPKPLLKDDPQWLEQRRLKKNAASAAAHRAARAAEKARREGLTAPETPVEAEPVVEAADTSDEAIRAKWEKAIRENPALKKNKDYGYPTLNRKQAEAVLTRLPKFKDEIERQDYFTAWLDRDNGKDIMDLMYLRSRVENHELSKEDLKEYLDIYCGAWTASQENYTYDLDYYLPEREDDERTADEKWVKFATGEYTVIGDVSANRDRVVLINPEVEVLKELSQEIKDLQAADRSTLLIGWGMKPEDVEGNEWAGMLAVGAAETAAENKAKKEAAVAAKKEAAKRDPKEIVKLSATEILDSVGIKEGRVDSEEEAEIQKVWIEAMEAAGISKEEYYYPRSGAGWSRKKRRSVIKKVKEAAGAVKPKPTLADDPQNFWKLSDTAVSNELSDIYDPDSPADVEFAEILEAAGFQKNDFYSTFPGRDHKSSLRREVIRAVRENLSGVPHKNGTYLSATKTDDGSLRYFEEKTYQAY